MLHASSSDCIVQPSLNIWLKLWRTSRKQILKFTNGKESWVGICHQSPRRHGPSDYSKPTCPSYHIWRSIMISVNVQAHSSPNTIVQNSPADSSIYLRLHIHVSLVQFSGSCLTLLFHRTIFYVYIQRCAPASSFKDCIYIASCEGSSGVRAWAESEWIRAFRCGRGTTATDPEAYLSIKVALASMKMAVRWREGGGIRMKGWEFLVRREGSVEGEMMERWMRTLSDHPAFSLQNDWKFKAVE